MQSLGLSPHPLGENTGDSQVFHMHVNIWEVLLWPFTGKLLHLPIKGYWITMGKLLNLPTKDLNYGLFLDNGKYHADMKTARHT